MLNEQHSTTITLPRGTLDLTYQTNSAINKNGAEKRDSYQLEDLLGFAQRINPKRAFLFVSKVLGRHIPVAPNIMRSAFTDLANLVPSDLPQPILVIGMAETAVGLSAGVHQALQTRYPQALLLNSTRHAQHGESSDPKGTDSLLTTFCEDHSHASQHLIYPSKDSVTQSQLLASKTLIMVDDEASTGNTCVNVVTALREAGLTQLEQVHLTTLVDWSLDQENLIHSQMLSLHVWRIVSLVLSFIAIICCLAHGNGQMHPILNLLPCHRLIPLLLAVKRLVILATGADFQR